MPRCVFIAIVFVTLIVGRSFAQDTLPNISAINYNGRIVISWKNNYGAKISTINVQRSNDSLKNFTTFASVLNPMNKQNGIVDTKSPGANMFYRVFVAFEGGTYIFSRSQRAALFVPPPPVVIVDSNMNNVNIPDNTSTDTIVTIQKTHILKPIIDSQKARTRATVIAPAPVTVPLGRFIFTGKDNNVIITLADAAKRKYSIKFFDEKGNFVFEVKKILESYLILDKVNFIHAGLFNYELYDAGELLEKYRVIIAKDTKQFSY